MTLVLGLTGGIASGKSTVSRWLHQYHFPIIDADKIAHQVVAPQTPGLQQIVALFSTEILTAAGTLNRQKLGQLVFADQHLLAQLTAITGPLIRQTILQQLIDYRRTAAALIVLDVPLLFESHYQQLADLTMLVDVSEPIQLQRLMARNQLSTQAAKQRIASQWPLSAKRQLADVIIDNNQTLAVTQQQVLKFLTQYQLV